MSGKLEGLLERVESATGPDRELDGRIWCAINGYEFVAWDGAGVVYRFREPGIRHMDADHINPITRSIDGALALVERVLPGAVYLIDNQDGIHFCSLQHEGITSNAVLVNCSAALAILAALLRALLAKDRS